MAGEKRKRSVNLTNDKAVKALRWIEGDPPQFEVKDKAHPGFYIRVSKGGTKRWYYRYTFKGKVRWMPLGHYPETSCKDAFTQYGVAFETRKSGTDPQAKSDAEEEARRCKKESEELTLSVLFHDHFWPRYAEKKKTSKNDYHYFTVKIEPVLGSRPAESITPDDVFDLLWPIEKEGYSTARLTLAVLRKMYNWAVMPGSWDESPREGNSGPGKRRSVLIGSVLNPCRFYRLRPENKPPPVDRALKNEEVKKLWHSLPCNHTGRILKLQLMTGCRVTEVRGMDEGEIDREANLWIVPGDRTRNGRPHLVSLTPAMLGLIGPPTEGYVFPAKSKEGFTTYSGVKRLLEKRCDKLKIEDVGTHTLRKTFVSIMARLGVPLEIRDRLTNHTNSAIDGLYNMHDYFQEKKEALEKYDKELRDIVGQPQGLT